jgi:hypothetical protein
VRFFLDNNLSPKLAAVLRALDHDVIHLRERFPENADDVDWIPRVAAEGWIVVTLDHAIRSRPHEREAWRASRATIFFLPKGVLDLRLHEQAAWIINAWEGIAKAAVKARPGQCFLLQMNRKVQDLQ